MAEEGGDTDGELLPGLGSVPAVARLAADAWYRSALWSVEAGIAAAERTGALVAEGLGIGGGGEAAGTAAAGTTSASGRGGGEASERRARRGPARAAAGRGTARTLRERGAELLDRAADVDEDPNVVHPGFARIIDQLAPDEARILKLLVNEGPQGIVYVNKAAPLGIGAREVARRLSMIGHEAGCLHIELVPAYLDNLVSHGLVAIRRDALEDEAPYQVIEAQPEVIAALQAAGGTIFRGQITRRSVHLTDFGRTFCQVCFPPEHLPPELGTIEVGEEVVGLAPPRLGAEG